MVKRGGQAVFYRRGRVQEEKDVNAMASMTEADYGPVTT
jgi:hypothetical protein